MVILSKLLNSVRRLCLKWTAVLIFGTIPVVAAAEIIWSGDYETGNFLQWHTYDDKTVAEYSQIPAYGRPSKAVNEGNGKEKGYYGDGSLLQIVTSPVRQGKYAAKFVVKNSINGSVPDDCDFPFPTCDRRRTELTAQAMLPKFYDAMPYMSERWLSVSHYLPEDWDTGGGGSGPTVFQIKPLNEHGASSSLAIELNDGAWKIWNRWEDDKNENGEIPWQQQMFYSGNEGGFPYPNKDDWPDGTAHFPNVSKSHAALQTVNIGGWTDWVIHIKFDARGASDGGTGFLRVWKREDSGPWVQVLDVFPGEVTRGGETFDHGIGYNSPANGSNPGGFGIKAGMYMAVERVWDLSSNRVIYNDNIKVGDENATFSAMSPDGSSPDTGSTHAVAPPEPPQLQLN